MNNQVIEYFTVSKVQESESSPVDVRQLCQDSSTYEEDAEIGVEGAGYEEMTYVNLPQHYVKVSSN